MPRRSPRLSVASQDLDQEISFVGIYEDWFEEVSRFCRVLGGPDADLDDLTQEVFLVVRRKLPGFDGRNLPGWLYKICKNTVSDHRRRAWFRRIWRKDRKAPSEDLQASSDGPMETALRREAKKTVHMILAQMGDKHRTAFVLFELEGYSGEEIAALLQIPVATVWTRLHHARKEFQMLAHKHLRTSKEASL